MMSTGLWIPASHGALQYMGRIDFTDPEAPVWVDPCTCVKVRFTGSFVKAVVTNQRGCWTNYLGAIVDGVQKKYALANEGRQTVTLFEDPGPGAHELVQTHEDDKVPFYLVSIIGS